MFLLFVLIAVGYATLNILKEKSLVSKIQYTQTLRGIELIITGHKVNIWMCTCVLMGAHKLICGHLIEVLVIGNNT